MKLLTTMTYLATDSTITLLLLFAFCLFLSFHSTQISLKINTTLLPDIEINIILFLDITNNINIWNRSTPTTDTSYTHSLFLIIQRIRRIFSFIQIYFLFEYNIIKRKHNMLQRWLVIFVCFSFVEFPLPGIAAHTCNNLGHVMSEVACFIFFFLFLCDQTSSPYRQINLSGSDDAR